MLLLLVACDLPFQNVTSELGHWVLVQPPVMATPPSPPPHGGAIVEGTRLCPRLRPVASEPDGCTWETVMTGQTYDPEGCLVAAPGELTWTFTSTCGVVDRISWTVLPFEGLRVDFDPLFEAWLREQSQGYAPYIVAVGEIPPVPEALAALPGTHPIGVVRLIHGEHGAVGYSFNEGDERQEPGVTVLPVSGHELRVEFTESSVEQVASFTLFGALLQSDEGIRMPIGVRAVAHDAEGARVFGLPVEWSLEGAETCLRPHTDGGGEVIDPMTLIGYEIDCALTPVGESTVRATLGPHSATLRLQWAVGEEETVEVEPPPAPPKRRRWWRR